MSWDTSPPAVLVRNVGGCASRFCTCVRPYGPFPPARGKSLLTPSPLEGEGQDGGDNNGEGEYRAALLSMQNSDAQPISVPSITWLQVLYNQQVDWLDRDDDRANASWS